MNYASQSINYAPLSASFGPFSMFPGSLKNAHSRNKKMHTICKAFVIANWCKCWLSIIVGYKKKHHNINSKLKDSHHRVHRIERHNAIYHLSAWRNWKFKPISHIKIPENKKERSLNCLYHLFIGNCSNFYHEAVKLKLEYGRFFQMNCALFTTFISCCLQFIVSPKKNYKTTWTAQF